MPILSSFRLSLFVSLLLFTVSCNESSGDRTDTDTPLKVLLITGGGWHDYETQEKLLTEAMNQRAGEIDWTVVHEGEGEPDYHISVLKEENWAAGYDVVIHNTGFGRVTDAEFVRHFVEHHAGTPAVLVHSATQSYRYAEPADPWFAFSGVKSMWHEDERIFLVENIAPDHPVMEGFPAEWETPVTDELYVIEDILGDITPLAHAWGVETEQYHPVTWIHETSGTRVFATTLGHNNGTFEDEAFLDKVARGLLWAAGR